MSTLRESSPEKSLDKHDFQQVPKTGPPSPQSTEPLLGPGTESLLPTTVRTQGAVRKASADTYYRE